jgi:hypothetical protein
MRFLAASSLLLLLVLIAGEAKAAPTFTCPAVSDPATKEKKARAIFEEAVQLEASDPESALVRYQCAAKLVDRPAIALRIGIVAERLHKDDVAIVAFERYLELAGTSAPDYEKMKAHVKELREKPKPSTDPPPSNTNPTNNPPTNGQNTPGQAPITHDQPPPPPPAPSQTTTYVGWGLVAGGGALAIAGSVFLAIAKSKSDDVHGLAIGTQWASDQARGTYESATQSNTIGIVLLAIAPVAIIAGGTMLFTSGAFSSSGGKSNGGAGSARSSSSNSPFLLRF